MNFFYILSGPLGYVMEWIYKLLPNYGWDIILFTLLINIVKIPLQTSQQKSMAKMSAFQPMIAEIQTKYKGISSLELLKEVGRLLNENNYIIENIDATIIAQRPKMLPHIQKMRENIAGVLGIQLNQINVKATTEEGLGFTGSGEGISSQAICALTSVSNYIYGEADMKNCCSGCNGCTKYQE